MIARVWHGKTTRENADAYEELLGTTILPEIDRVRGFRGAELFRRDLGDEVEFMTVTRFDSLDAVREFAGEEYELAVISDEAHQLLSRFDERAATGSALPRLCWMTADGALLVRHTYGRLN